MAKHTGLPESGADHSADSPSRDPGLEFSQDFDQDDDPAPASPPARFGRLALWVASASALTVGVLATVAYGVWFDQDQRAYAKAMTVAQQTLSAGVVTMPKRQTLAAGVTIAPEQQTLPPVHRADATDSVVGSCGSGHAACGTAAHARRCCGSRSDHIGFVCPAGVK
jgi:hypothetical protein